VRAILLRPAQGCRHDAICFAMETAADLGGCLGVLLFLAASCPAKEVFVRRGSDLAGAFQGGQPGDVFILERGAWVDSRVMIHANGTLENPVVLRAESPGQVVFSGKSELRISGNHVVVDGLVFEKPRGVADLISFRTDSKRLASDCILKNCSVTDEGGVDSELASRWVSVYGSRNRVEKCSFSGKRDVGATLVIWVGEAPGEHVVSRNWFGPREPLGKNGGETIRVGTSDVSLRDSFTIVEENYFQECDGEVEAISNKSCGNTYRHNVFDRCAGTVTLRHGHRCVVDANVFLGRGKRGSGGVRVIGEDHQVINNYFGGLQGDGSRAALSFANGVPNGKLHEYAPVKRALIAFNTIVDCKVPMAIGISGMKTATVPPEDCVIANNAFSNRNRPVVESSRPTPGWQWIGNLGQSFAGSQPTFGLELAELALVSGANGRMHPEKGSALIDRGQPLPAGFSFPTTDIEGRVRGDRPDVGCEEWSPAPGVTKWPTPESVGPAWKK